MNLLAPEIKPLTRFKNASDYFEKVTFNSRSLITTIHGTLATIRPVIIDYNHIKIRLI